MDEDQTAGRAGSTKMTWREKDLPIDKGWAYVIMFGVAMWNFFIAATLKSFGLLYVELLDVYKERPAVTGLVGGIFGGVMTMLAPLAGHIADTHSVKEMRLLVFFFGIVASFGFAISAIMPTLWAVIITYGVIAGVAAGIMDTPILSLLGVYFRKKRSLASGVAFSGSSVGTVALPPILALCIEEYTLRGALLILGALWLHTALVGVLMRPIPSPHQLEKLQILEVDGDCPASLVVAVTGEDECHQIKGGSYSFGACQSGNLVKCDDQEINVREESDSQTAIMEVPSTRTAGKAKQRGIFMDYVHFFRTPKLLPLSLTFIFASFGYYNQFFVFPPLAHELGLSRLFGSALVSVPNILEIFSRVATGVFGDRFVHLKTPLVLLNCLLMTGFGLFISLFAQKMSLMVYCAIFGIFGGMFVPLILPILYDVVEPSQIGRASCLFPLLTGIGISLGPPLLGVVSEFSGTYVTCLQVCTGSYFLAAVCLFFAMDKKILLCTRPLKGISE